MALLNYLKI